MTDLPVTQDCILSDLDMELYHGQGVCDGPSVSSSNLRAIAQQSPAHAYAKWSGNPDREPEESRALNFGSAAHALILGDEVFDRRHVVSPFADFAKIETIDGVVWKPRRPEPPDDAASKRARADYEKLMLQVEAGEVAFKSDWIELMAEEGLRVITEVDYGHIQNMAESMAAETRIEGILQGELEQSVFYRDPKTGLWVKSRMDVRPLDDTLSDFKTTTDAAPHACARAMDKHRYDMQFALGCEALWRVAGQKITGCIAVFVEKSPPYAVTPYPISTHAIERAAQENRRALNTFAECLKRGEWPGYLLPDNYLPPDWREKAHQRDEESGFLPKREELGWLDEMESA